MVGPGSGNFYHWWRPTKKTAVEHCRHLDANRWMREGILRAGLVRFGGWQWQDARTGEQTSAIGFEVDTTDLSNPWVRLFYSFTKSDDRLDYRVRLQATRPHLGGLRWWFLCPLYGRWGPCGRRVGKLYLPPGGRRYGYRHCHDLTYTSCQESGRFDMLWRLLAQRMGSDPSTVKRVMERRDQGLP